MIDFLCGIDDRARKQYIEMGRRMCCLSGAAFRRWILWPNWQRWCPELERTDGAAFLPLVQVRFHGVLALNSRYRESVRPLRVRPKMNWASQVSRRSSSKA